MLPYQILHPGIYRAKDISFEALPGKRKYPPEIKTMIEQSWRAAKADPHIKIYNGKVASLLEYTPIANSLHIKVQETDYKSFYGTNVKNIEKIADASLAANALAACAVLETTDATIVVGKRSSALAEGSDLWHIPGGTLEYCADLSSHKALLKDLGLPLRRLSALNPIFTMMREVKEELNILPSHISMALCLGLGENLQMKKPEFLCYFRLRISSMELQKLLANASDADEHSDIAFVPVEEIMQFCTGYPFAPIGLAAIARYLEFMNDIILSMQAAGR